MAGQVPRFPPTSSFRPRTPTPGPRTACSCPASRPRLACDLECPGPRPCLGFPGGRAGAARGGRTRGGLATPAPGLRAAPRLLGLRGSAWGGGGTRSCTTVPRAELQAPSARCCLSGAGRGAAPPAGTCPWCLGLGGKRVAGWAGGRRCRDAAARHPHAVLSPSGRRPFPEGPQPSRKPNAGPSSTPSPPPVPPPPPVPCRCPTQLLLVTGWKTHPPPTPVAPSTWLGALPGVPDGEGVADSREQESPATLAAPSPGLHPPDSARRVFLVVPAASCPSTPGPGDSAG